MESLQESCDHLKEVRSGHEETIRRLQEEKTLLVEGNGALYGRIQNLEADERQLRATNRPSQPSREPRLYRKND